MPILGRCLPCWRVESCSPAEADAGEQGGRREVTILGRTEEAGGADGRPAVSHPQLGSGGAKESWPSVASACLPLSGLVAILGPLASGDRLPDEFLPEASCPNMATCRRPSGSGELMPRGPWTGGPEPSGPPQWDPDPWDPAGGHWDPAGGHSQDAGLEGRSQRTPDATELAGSPADSPAGGGVTSSERVRCRLVAPPLAPPRVVAEVGNLRLEPAGTAHESGEASRDARRQPAAASSATAPPAALQACGQICW